MGAHDRQYRKVAAVSFQTYLINLDRAKERLQQMDTQLKRLGINYTRISAVLGDDLKEPIAGFDERAFNTRTGKHKNKREIGCYFSHLKTIEAFLKTNSSHALILEDDAELPDDTINLLEAACQKGDKWDLLRLSSSRQGKFITLDSLLDGRSLAINTKVLKNTAAYMINRRAAKAILKHLQPMQWPYDVALDRDWTMGIRTACITPFPFKLSDVSGQIPKAPRMRAYRSTSFHLFHLLDRVRRHRWRLRTHSELQTKGLIETNN